MTFENYLLNIMPIEHIEKRKRMFAGDLTMAYPTEYRQYSEIYKWGLSLNQRDLIVSAMKHLYIGSGWVLKLNTILKSGRYSDADKKILTKLRSAYVEFVKRKRDEISNLESWVN